MSLQSRLSDLISAFGTDVKKLFTQNLGVAALSATSGTCTADLTNGVLTWTITPTAAWTLAITNVPAGAVYVTVDVNEGGGAYAQTQPSGLTWAEGGAPTVTASKWRVITYYTKDQGTTWKASYVKQA